MDDGMSKLDDGAGTPPLKASSATDLPQAPKQRRSLRDWHPIELPPGCQRLSEEVDQVVYGVCRD
jgi:hypothetical protein